MDDERAFVTFPRAFGYLRRASGVEHVFQTTIEHFSALYIVSELGLWSDWTSCTKGRCTYVEQEENWPSLLSSRTNISVVETMPPLRGFEMLNLPARHVASGGILMADALPQESKLSPRPCPCLYAATRRSRRLTRPLNITAPYASFTPFCLSCAAHFLLRRLPSAC
jgi:hypothetical protein